MHTALPVDYDNGGWECRICGAPSSPPGPDAHHLSEQAPLPLTPEPVPAPRPPAPLPVPVDGDLDPVTTTLDDAQRYVRDRAEDGTTCLACGQHVQVYRRTINAGMARSLATMFRAALLQPQHVPTTVGRTSAEEGKLAYWDLIVACDADGGTEEPVRGWWRVTPHGEAFLRGQVSVPRYACVYNGVPLRHEGDLISMHDALGHPFSIEELLTGVWPLSPTLEHTS